MAVKFLPPEWGAEPDFEARFAREARALALLSHPHVIGVHDFGTNEDGHSYLVMELAAGGTLAERLPLAPAQAAHITAQLCDGVAYAHRKGIIHRDIKPANVLFDDEGRPKLADFGIARLLDQPGTGPLTRAQVVLGTPTYMAPEVRRGAPPEPRADIYALGVLLHEMITGRPIDAGISVPGELGAIIRRATAADAADRYPDAESLGRALRAVPTAPVGDAFALPAEEQSWARAVALTLAGATAVALYALLVSFTPRTVSAADDLPFLVFGRSTLADGRVHTLARFEMWPTVMAAGAVALALAAYGGLRRHWRRTGLDVYQPDRPLPGTRGLLTCAIVLDGLFVVHLALEGRGHTALGTYLPVLGGVGELVMLYLFAGNVLEAQRTGRLLRREPRLWLALGMALIPPVTSFSRLIFGA